MANIFNVRALFISLWTNASHNLWKLGASFCSFHTFSKHIRRIFTFILTWRIGWKWNCCPSLQRILNLTLDNDSNNNIAMLFSFLMLDVLEVCTLVPFFAPDIKMGTEKEELKVESQLQLFSFSSLFSGWNFDHLRMKTNLFNLYIHYAVVVNYVFLDNLLRMWLWLRLRLRLKFQK